MTGLEHTESGCTDDMELNNHMPGGNKGIHVDTDLDEHYPNTLKDRVATAMIYVL